MWVRSLLLWPDTRSLLMDDAGRSFELAVGGDRQHSDGAAGVVRHEEIATRGVEAHVARVGAMRELVIQWAQRPSRRIAGEGTDAPLGLLIDRKEDLLAPIQSQPGGVDHPWQGLHRVERTRVGIEAKDRDAIRGA